MFKYSIKAFLFPGLLCLIFQCHIGLCSESFYTPCVEETEAFKKVIALFGQQETFLEGHIQLNKLVEEGAPQAFGVICQIHKAYLPEEYIPYIKNTRQFLVEKGNFEGLAKMGFVLCQLDRREAYYFLKEALNNKAKLSSVEDVEYNYIYSLSHAGQSLLTDRFNPFAEAWQTLKPYLHRSKEKEFERLTLVLFGKLKERTNQDSLVNEIGHYLMDNGYLFEKTLDIYKSI